MFGITDLMAYVLTVLIALLNPKGLVFFPAVMIQFVATDTTSPMISLTSAVNNGEKHLVDFIRQPDGKSLGILGQVT